jgi:hypothetical protein
MKKRKWRVGSLAELYPEGNVGQTDVCVMGLNQNRGQQILLRIRTDDLKGFRKNLSIREVLYHELAHNVHSEHNSDFFQLMRQIKNECLAMDWTQGQGSGVFNSSFNDTGVEGGTYCSGGEVNRNTQDGLSARELARRAASKRLNERMGEKCVRTQCQSVDSLYSDNRQECSETSLGPYSDEKDADKNMHEV